MLIGMRQNKFFGLFAVVPSSVHWFAAAIPFVLVLVIYFVASDARHRDNPQDKLLPTASQLVRAIEQVAFTEDRRTGKYLLWNDTASSLKRLVLGLGIAAVVGLMLGINIGLFPGFKAFSQSALTFVSMVPPLAILPILFIVVGIDEVAKVVLIVIGVFPLIARDITLSVSKIPKQQLIKSMTLGASELDFAYRIVLPQIMPRLLDSLRLSIGAGWLFLIASEAIASTDGLGYRIFLVRRYLAMDIIIPYVLWITFIGFAMDFGLRKTVIHFYPWYRKT